MQPKRTVCLTILLLFVGLVSSGWAFPGPQLSLSENWTSARVVVFAQVRAAQIVENQQHIELSLSSVLKGDPGVQEGENLRIHTTLTAPCAAPFHFEEGMKLIVFLQLDPDSKGYKPTARSGCIEVDDRGYEQYAAMLKKLPAILAEKETETRHRLLLEWHMQCALQEETRQEGVWEIAAYQRGPIELKNLFTKDHEQKLLKTLLSERPPGKDASALVRLLEDCPSDAFDKYLLECLRRSHESGWEDVTMAAVEVLPERLGIELAAVSKLKLKAWWQLNSSVCDLDPMYHKTDDPLAQARQFLAEKQRQDILWGALSSEVHAQCQQALQSRQ